MTDKAQFAAVLAQVIPVAILAVVVESRSGHEARAKAPAGVAPAIWELVLEAIIVTGLVFVEMAALVTAAGSDTGVLNWLAGRPGAIGVGVLLVQVGQLYVANLAAAYEGNNKLSPTQAKVITNTTRCVLWVSVLLALVTVWVFYLRDGWSTS
ncbi:hypothetical protein NFX46_19455 [Streptomyces phaeoluteigriseus]|uniref:Conjugal transfer protein TrbL n=1 Tax=Streptomyces phaeoluteigriseus TaxID=114686 RepID=A0ABY4ZAA6_9ACTN|nr:hypothetical protein [Streptomyces phaeoluteigriseus]USQ85744.1 hypothetical protein NFX46_19455 [Streptomyces phaeoluteigriseus]